MHAGIFETFAQRLSQIADVFGIDLPGHGLSHDCDAPLYWQSLADCARVLPSAHWFGWSLGGVLSLQLALERPELVESLTMCAATPCFVAREHWPQAQPIHVFEQFAQGLEHSFEATIERFLALETLGSTHARAELRLLKERVYEHGAPSKRALQDGLACLKNTDELGRLYELAVPSLWLAGGRDRLIPPQAMQKASALVPHGRFALIEGAGHAPFLTHGDHIIEQLRAIILPARGATR
jgi:pimeloyl-[acyl-carrier protein] methyl ester esterase